MMLGKDVELIDGEPIAYIRSICALVLSDMHLGFESYNAGKGILVPKVNLRSIKKIVEKALEGRSVSKIIITGDIKNDFSTVEIEEIKEIEEFAAFAESKGLEVVLVKGNHDNFIDKYKNRLGIKIHGRSFQEGGYLFFHGDTVPAIRKGLKMMVMGHEHPAISIISGSGRKESVRCFLEGRYKGVKLLVMPAASYFAGLSSVTYGEMLSPVFRKVDVGNMRAIAFGYGRTIDFGKVSMLRLAARRAKEERL